MAASKAKRISLDVRRVAICPPRAGTREYMFTMLTKALQVDVNPELLVVFDR
jgi:hypothetical protein